MNQHHDLATTVKELTTGTRNHNHTRAHIESQALCTQIGGDIWYPEYGTDNGITNKAIKICQTCPTQHDCLAIALATKEPHGIWGGHTTTSRQKLRRQLRLT